MTDEEKILMMQSPSTRRAMEAHKAGKSLNNAEWPPKGWLAVENAKSMEEAVNARSLSYQEVAVYSKLRYDRGGHLAQIHKDAEAKLPEEKKNRAVQAFMFVRKKFKDLMMDWGLAPEIEKVRLKHED